MIGTVLLILGVLLAALLALAVVWFVGMRTKWPPVRDFQRRVNRRVFNPRQMRTAGTAGAYAGIVRHVGRRSGRAYETPVVPLPTEDGFVILLPYGDRPDWVRNVLAAGGATIVHEGETYTVTAPELLDTADSGHEFSPSEQREIRLFGNTRCLRVRRVPSASSAS
ncbi:MAG: nitroreductase family deazaflavin-dependent oxidoreductase [Acidimicrobiales bacterium]|nr:nitroreductase family deazaflavin-dependent oxidoreductase [Acidimicrobiales bacterium]